MEATNYKDRIAYNKAQKAARFTRKLNKALMLDNTQGLGGVLGTLFGHRRIEQLSYREIEQIVDDHITKLLKEKDNVQKMAATRESGHQS
jgi:hypothetical protein